MIREELKRPKLEGRAARRAWEFEKKLKSGKGNKIARRCLKEIERREGWREVSNWEEGRRRFRVMRGLKEKGERRAGGVHEREDFGRVEEMEKARERWESILRSPNRLYKGVVTEGIPGYLDNEWGEERWGRVARFRLGQGIRGERKLGKKELRLCRRCGWEEETWEHILEVCGRGTIRGGGYGIGCAIF